MIGADEIARALGRPLPTEEQRAVIEAPLEPALVVAGAGSGKTETMAGRVLWLVANGLVAPGEVLGLTFTRKAAAELGRRVRERLAALARAGLVPGEPDPFDAPVVATYNSFANSVFRDNALLVGRDGDGAVLGEAGAWQLARRVVIRSRDERLVDLGRSLDVVTQGVLDLSRALVENLAEPEAVRAMAREFAALAELPPGGRGEYAGALKAIEAVGALDTLLDLAAEYEAAKRERGLIEYSDQVALALRAAELSPAIGQEWRERTRVVLLDEYQDTSVVQTRLLAALFGGHAVMAVGDPHQSIYGWRGASASNLAEFAGRFGAGGAPFTLARSWRNGTAILEVANRLVRPLTRDSAVPVPPLEQAPTASSRPVDCVVEQNVRAEAERVAAWFAERLAADPAAPPSMALLLRTRRTQPWFLEALRRRGIDVHVLGLGGLLAEPEVADVVAMLAVIDDPSAGLELLRVLAGSRWRIGVRDLAALRELASWLRDRDHAQQRFDEQLRERMRATLTEGEGGSIVDALDFLGTAPPGHAALSGFTEEGLARLRDAAATVAGLRRRGRLGLRDLVVLVQLELRLDIEVAANEARPLGAAPMEALLDAVDGYLALAEDAARGDLGGFLAWLRDAEQKEDLAPRPEDPEPGTVQVLTIHGAKGLEWDHVAVPRWVEQELPSPPREGGTGWLGFGRLPFEFRGDAADLPVLPWGAVATRKEFADAQSEFGAAVLAHAEREERRLAYVAVTRARHGLLLSASFWATQTKPRRPSPFLVELAEAGLVPPLPTAPESEENPLGDAVQTVVWPFDPLGNRRGRVEAAARAVREAEPEVRGPWAEELGLLLAERERRAGGRRVAVPPRVPASRFHEYVADPEGVAAALARPMPERPYRATRLGTLFHAWVEARSGVAGGSDELDAEAFELDDAGDPVDAERLAALRATFEASEWAGRRPREVEREIHLPFDGRTVICKIDAVYDLPGDRVQIVDWKTGRAPADAADLERKQLQLALYRLAYARWAGIDPERIEAVFYFVAEDRVVTPEHIDSEAELLARWRAAFPS
ncbi:MAG: ATP-dependent helicase [Actinomycetales bacterium]|nr:ATP-dependent helicase [Actinomycetales bacterium]